MISNKKYIIFFLINTNLYVTLTEKFFSKRTWLFKRMDNAVLILLYVIYIILCYSIKIEINICYYSVMVIYLQAIVAHTIPTLFNALYLKSDETSFVCKMVILLFLNWREVVFQCFYSGYHYLVNMVKRPFLDTLVSL